MNSDLLLKSFNLPISGDRPLSSIHRSYILASQKFVIERLARNSALWSRIAVSRISQSNTERRGVNRAYANVVEALRTSSTCRSRLILNTCFLVLAGSTPTRREWSLYGIVSLPSSHSLSLSLSLYLRVFCSDVAIVKLVEPISVPSEWSAFKWPRNDWFLGHRCCLDGRYSARAVIINVFSFALFSVNVLHV